MRPKHDPVPQIPIAPILEELGGYDVPQMHGPRTKKMLCPFHSDTTPSASVSEFGFRCFTCGRTGDAISLLREEEGLSFADALERATSLAGISSSSVPGNTWSGSIFDL